MDPDDSVHPRYASAPRTWPRGSNAASKDRPGAPNRAFEILRSMMFRDEEWGLRERGTNPCLGIAKNPRAFGFAQEGRRAAVLVAPGGANST